MKCLRCQLSIAAIRFDSLCRQVVFACAGLIGVQLLNMTGAIVQPRLHMDEISIKCCLSGVNMTEVTLLTKLYALRHAQLVRLRG